MKQPRPLNTRQIEAVTVPYFFPLPCPPPPLSTVFYTIPSFARIKKPRWYSMIVNSLLFITKTGYGHQMTPVFILQFISLIKKP